MKKIILTLAIIIVIAISATIFWVIRPHTRLVFSPLDHKQIVNYVKENNIYDYSYANTDSYSCILSVSTAKTSTFILIIDQFGKIHTLSSEIEVNKDLDVDFGKQAGSIGNSGGEENNYNLLYFIINDKKLKKVSKEIVVYLGATEVTGFFNDSGNLIITAPPDNIDMPNSFIIKNKSGAKVFEMINNQGIFTYKKYF